MNFEVQRNSSVDNSIQKYLHEALAINGKKIRSLRKENSTESAKMVRQGTIIHCFHGLYLM